MTAVPPGLAIADVSRSAKAGVKGPRASLWLHECGVPIPPRANNWLPLPGHGVVARLGDSEFLLDEPGRPDLTSAVVALLRNRPVGVYPVLRQDTVIALFGTRINEVLLEVCSFNFESKDPTELVLTSMVGVSVVAIAMQADGLPMLKIWADPSFGPYLWRTLLGIVREHGGEAAPTIHRETMEEAQ